jgi:hypothetical protein
MTKQRTQFDAALIADPARRAALFAAARKIDPRVSGYTGSDSDGNHHMQVWGDAVDVVVPASALTESPRFDVSDLGTFSLAEMLETNYHDEDFCEWAKSCPIGAAYDGGGEPCVRIA